MINIKPLSVNNAWRGGRRFKTNDYLAYETELLYRLPKLEIPDGGLFLEVNFGVSTRNCDLDNLLKPLIDILSKKYQFNDNMIYRIDARKYNVKKGSEYIEFLLKSYPQLNL